MLPRPEREGDGEGEGGRGEGLHAGEAENGSSKVCQFQDLLHFIFKTSGPLSEEAIQIGTAYWDYFIQESTV